MLARHSDPIAAIATAPGRGGVGIVRVSGKGLAPLVEVLCGRALQPRYATYLPFHDADGQPIDQGLALYFPAPHSYTGEDVLELQAHGGPVVLQLLLERCLEAGVQALPGLRVAQPGEFTEPAFPTCACWSRPRSISLKKKSTSCARQTRAGSCQNCSKSWRM